jgi:enoyl-CoA hydratase/carnithine racemase
VLLRRHLQVIGHAAAERLLLSGSMVPPQRALQLGLVDELVQDKAQLLTRAEVSNAALTTFFVTLGQGARN